MRKKILVINMILFSFMNIVGVYGQSGNIIDLITSSYSAKAFTTKPISDKEVEAILKCGVRAPSARNLQPWYFTVVKDMQIMKKLLPDVKEGNILILISGSEKNSQAINIDFDCALATENMYLAAQALGLGSHIYTGPVNNINTKFKSLISIPQDYRVVSMLKIGNVEKQADATSGASSRKSISDIVNYK